MDKMLKVFASGKEQSEIATDFRVLERYAAFVLVAASKKQADALARKYPVEDMTSLYAIHNPSLRINTAQPRVDTAGKVRAHAAYKGAKRLSPGKHHYLVQFIGPIKQSWIAALKKVGGEPREPYENFTYVVRLGDAQLPKVSALPFVRWVGHLPNRARIAPSLALSVIDRKKVLELPRTRKLASRYTVEFFGPDDRKAALREVAKLGFEVLDRAAKGNVLIVEATGTEATRAPKLQKLSAVHGVRVIRARSLKRSSNDVAAGIMGTARSLASAGLGLSGKGEIVAVCDTGLDTGDPAHIHPDFAGRVAWIKSYPITPEFNRDVSNPGADDGPADVDDGHGTHVAGSVLGDGTASLAVPGITKPIRGLAFGAKLVFQAIEQEVKWKDPQVLAEDGRYALAGIPADITKLFSDAYRKRARIHSDSWGGGDPGDYDEQCEQLDRFVWKHRTFCVVVSAGNDGVDGDGDGKINPMSVSSPGTAKNCITVGACENDRPGFNAQVYGDWWPDDFPANPFRDDPMADDSDTVVAFSSRGPTLDGRVKPDLIAPGTFILSTRSTQIAPNNKAWAAFPPSRDYFHMGGTSMATPLTAGAVAVIREHLRKNARIKSPSAALLKAALILGCQRLPGYAPADALLDNHQGYGRVNLDAALAPESPARSEFHDYAGLRTGQERRLTLKVKSDGSALRIVLAYSDYPGSTLVNNLNLMVTDPNGKRYLGNQGGANATALDVTNNVEVVHVRKPAAGDWTLQIVASNVPSGPQRFALAYCAHLR
jgi:hypothetical protein